MARTTEIPKQETAKLVASFCTQLPELTAAYLEPKHVYTSKILGTISREMRQALSSTEHTDNEKLRTISKLAKEAQNHVLRLAGSTTTVPPISREIYTTALALEATADKMAPQEISSHIEKNLPELGRGEAVIRSQDYFAEQTRRLQNAQEAMTNFTITALRSPFAKDNQDFTEEQARLNALVSRRYKEAYSYTRTINNITTSIAKMQEELTGFPFSETKDLYTQLEAVKASIHTDHNLSKEEKAAIMADAGKEFVKRSIEKITQMQQELPQSPEDKRTFYIELEVAMLTLQRGNPLSKKETAAIERDAGIQFDASRAAHVKASRFIASEPGKAPLSSRMPESNVISATLLPPQRAASPERS